MSIKSRIGQMFRRRRNETATANHRHDQRVEEAARNLDTLKAHNQAYSNKNDGGTTFGH